jgi:pectate lyase
LGSLSCARCRFGYVHVLNNDYDGWAQYAVGGSAAPTILSQGNRFRASSSSAKEVKFLVYLSIHMSIDIVHGSSGGISTLHRIIS